MIGKEIQASSIIRSEKCSSVLSLFNFVGERCNPSFFFTREDSTVESNFLLDFLDLFRRNYSFRVNPSLYLLMASDKWCIFVLLLTILVIVSKIPRRYPSNGKAEKRAPAKSTTVMIEEIGTQNRVCTFKTWQHGSLCSQSSQNWQDALLAFVLDDVQKIQPFLLPKCTKSYFRLK